MSGDCFRCVVSNEAGEVVSGGAVLTVFTPIPASIVKQPELANVPVGQPATFTLVAKGDPTPDFVWQFYNVKSARWEELKDNSIYAGVHSASLVVNSATMNMSGDLFRCRVGNGFPPEPLVSSVVVLTIKK
jgi:hypothetical protein